MTLKYTTVSHLEPCFIWNLKHLQMPVKHVRWPCIFRVLANSEHFIQAFSRIFRHIQGYWCIFSHIHRRAKRKGRRDDNSLALFQNPKKWPDFVKIDLDCVHLWVEFSFQNVVLRVSRRKNSKMILCGVSFSRVFDKMFSEVLSFTNPPLLPWKISGCAPPP